MILVQGSLDRKTVGDVRRRKNGTGTTLKECGGDERVKDGFAWSRTSARYHVLLVRTHSMLQAVCGLSPSFS